MLVACHLAIAGLVCTSASAFADDANRPIVPTSLRLPPKPRTGSPDLQRQYAAAARTVIDETCQYPAVAQAPAPANPELQRAYDEAFQEMLKRPGDLDVLFRFAAIAAQTGDLEGAIAALERMLVQNQNLVAVRLELGVLYYRLGSFAVAKSYIESVLKTPNLPADLQAKATQVMTQIDDKQSPSHFSGEFFFGWRYQSNANFGPATSSVMLFGQIADLNQGSIAKADWGVVASAQIRHAYDLSSDGKAQLVTTFLGSGTRQFQLGTTNLALVDVTTGPQFQAFASTFSDVTLRPFLAGGSIWVNDVPYYSSYGGGLEINALLADNLTNNTVFSFRQRNYPDSWFLPANSLYRGNEYNAATTFQWGVTPWLTLAGGLIGQRFEADVAPWLSYYTWSVGGGPIIRFDDPLFETNLPWTISLAAINQWWAYDAPDVQVDSATNRRQSDLSLNLAIQIPFDSQTTFVVTAGRIMRTSNLPNYAFTNDIVMMGVSWRPWAPVIPRPEK